MPHYRVVTYNDQDYDTWPRLKGKAEFEKVIITYLNKGYTCVGGIIKNICWKNTQTETVCLYYGLKL